MALSISLLHATYRSGAPAVAVRRTWLEHADSSSEVEHIFAMDEDDELSLRTTAGLRRVINPPSPERVSAVRNWNSAAASAQGDLLFVIADDLTPPPHWDSTLRSFVGTLDPNKFAFVVCVGDLDKGAELIRHPVISRQFYSRFGLFGPEFAVCTATTTSLCVRITEPSFSMARR